MYTYFHLCVSTYRYACAIMHVCVHACAYGGLKLMLRIIPHCSPALFTESGNQSNHELFNMTTHASHLDLEIPCLGLPKLELLTTVTPTWHFAWVSKALVLTFCQQEFLCLVTSPAPYHSLHTMDFFILTYCANLK